MEEHTKCQRCEEKEWFGGLGMVVRLGLKKIIGCLLSPIDLSSLPLPLFNPKPR